jgi:ABC-type sugar transport system permease subunit
MALRRTTTGAPTPPETAPPPAARPGPEAPRRVRRRPERVAPYVFVAPLLAVFAVFYLWPALVTVLSSFFRWGLLRPWSPVEPARWRFVGLDNYTTTLTDPSFWNAVLNTTSQMVVFPVLVVPFSLLVSILIWYTGRGGTVYRTVFILPMTISLAAAGVIWSFVYNADPQIGVLNAVLDRLGILGADWRVGPLELHPGSWLSNPGVLHLGFADLRLTNLALIVPAFWAFTGFGVITITAGLTAVPYELVEAAKVDGANAWQAARHILVPALRRSLVVVGVVSVIFALRTFDIVYVMTGGGPAQDTMVLALLLWQQAFAFLDTPQGGQATAIAVLMSAVLVAGSWRYLRQLLAGRSR